MPVIVKLPELLALEPGERLTGVRATLKSAYDLKNFGSGEKAGTVQNGVLVDPESGKTMKVKVWNHDDLTRFVGDEIILLAHQSSRGVTGLKISENEWQGKVENILEVGDKASITTNDGPPTGDADEEEDDVPDAEAPKKAAPRQAKATENRTATQPVKGSWKLVGQDLRRLGAFASAAYIEVVTRVVPTVAEHSGFAMNQDNVHATAMALMIQFMRDKGGIHSVPEKEWKGYGEAIGPVGRVSAAEAKEQKIIVGYKEETDDEDSLPF